MVCDLKSDLKRKRVVLILYRMFINIALNSVKDPEIFHEKLSPLNLQYLFDSILSLLS
jgi:hypothetical protein